MLVSPYVIFISTIKIFIVVSLIEVFILSSHFIKNLLTAWGWSFLFAIIGDFVFVEGIALIVQTIMTLIVGAAPDACGKCRNCWLQTLL